MDFHELQMRLVAFLRERIRSGELTERGLARLTRVSQPHIHNVLKGNRQLAIETSDRLLRRLRTDLRDLVRPDDAAESQRRQQPRQAQRPPPPPDPPQTRAKLS